MQKTAESLFDEMMISDGQRNSARESPLLSGRPGEPNFQRRNSGSKSANESMDSGWLEKKSRRPAKPLKTYGSRSKAKKKLRNQQVLKDTRSNQHKIDRFCTRRRVQPDSPVFDFRYQNAEKHSQNQHIRFPSDDEASDAILDLTGDADKNSANVKNRQKTKSVRSSNDRFLDKKDFESVKFHEKTKETDVPRKKAKKAEFDNSFVSSPKRKRRYRNRDAEKKATRDALEEMLGRISRPTSDDRASQKSRKTVQNTSMFQRFGESSKKNAESSENSGPQSSHKILTRKKSTDSEVVDISAVDDSAPKSTKTNESQVRKDYGKNESGVRSRQRAEETSEGDELSSPSVISPTPQVKRKFKSAKTLSMDFSIDSPSFQNESKKRSIVAWDERPRTPTEFRSSARGSQCRSGEKIHGELEGKLEIGNSRKTEGKSSRRSGSIPNEHSNSVIQAESALEYPIYAKDSMSEPSRRNLGASLSTGSTPSKGTQKGQLLNYLSKDKESLGAKESNPYLLRSASTSSRKHNMFSESQKISGSVDEMGEEEDGRWSRNEDSQAESLEFSWNRGSISPEIVGDKDGKVGWYDQVANCAENSGVSQDFSQEFPPLERLMSGYGKWEPQKVVNDAAKSTSVTEEAEDFNREFPPLAQLMHGYGKIENEDKEESIEIPKIGSEWGEELPPLEHLLSGTFSSSSFDETKSHKKAEICSSSKENKPVGAADEIIDVEVVSLTSPKKISEEDGRLQKTEKTWKKKQVPLKTSKMSSETAPTKKKAKLKRYQDKKDEGTKNGKKLDEPKNMGKNQEEDSERLWLTAAHDFMNVDPFAEGQEKVKARINQSIKECRREKSLDNLTPEEVNFLLRLPAHKEGLCRVQKGQTNSWRHKLYVQSGKNKQIRSNLMSKIPILFFPRGVADFVTEMLPHIYPAPSENVSDRFYYQSVLASEALVVIYQVIKGLSSTSQTEKELTDNWHNVGAWAKDQQDIGI